MYIIDKSTEEQQTFSQRIPFAALAKVLTDGEIETICGVNGDGPYFLLDRTAGER